MVSWTNEEGARFSPPMIASGVFVGRYELDWALDLIADDGPRLGEELERIGYNGDKPCTGDVDAYFELHIEQGPILDAEKRQVGIVTGGYPSYGMRVRFDGETAHTGPTPMDLRHNALIAGARFLTAVDDIGWDFAVMDGKATGSRLAAWPNKPGILSETAQCVADVRHPDPITAKVMAEKMRRAAHEAGAKAGAALPSRMNGRGAAIFSMPALSRRSGKRRFVRAGTGVIFRRRPVTTPTIWRRVSRRR